MRTAVRPARVCRAGVLSAQPACADPDAAAGSCGTGPDDVTTVGLFVDPDERLIDGSREGALDLIQLAWRETPERCQDIRDRAPVCPVMKAIKVASRRISRRPHTYGSVDWLMFDAKAPKEMTDALPGGNALAFDWTLLAARNGLCPGCWRADSTRQCGGGRAGLRGHVVDVSSGVNRDPGRKDPHVSKRFLTHVKNL